MPAAIYTRISKDDRDEGLGVERQERLCGDLAKRTGLDVAVVIVDNDLSAYRSAKRAGFAELVMLKDGVVDSVVTYHADRLYRRSRNSCNVFRVSSSTSSTQSNVRAFSGLGARVPASTSWTNRRLARSWWLGDGRPAARAGCRRHPATTTQSSRFALGRRRWTGGCDAEHGGPAGSSRLERSSSAVRARGFDREHHKVDRRRT